LFRLAPIQSLQINARNMPDLDSLVTSPGLGRIRSLKLSCCRFGEKVIRGLVESSCTQLEELRFESSGIGGDGLRSLASSSALRQVKALGLRDDASLKYGWLTMERAFASSTDLPTLEHCDLRDNRLSVRA